jgi:drug/metabolite transporter (DMT)-like permease
LLRWSLNSKLAVFALPFDFTGAWPDARTLGLILLLGLVCTALAHTMFIASLTAVSAHTASIVAALEPAYGIALAALLLGERPTLRTLAGCALLVAAAIVASRSSRDAPTMR